MDLNFEEFSFNHGDILQQTKNLSESEKVEFLIGYIKDLTESYDKLFEVSQGLVNLLSQSKKAISINLDSISKVHDRLVDLEKIVDAHNQLIESQGRLMESHTKYSDVLNMRVDLLDKITDRIDERLDIIDP